jgi:hypothetical protein
LAAKMKKMKAGAVKRGWRNINPEGVASLVV